MVLRLVAYIADHVWYRRWTDTDSAITILPAESVRLAPNSSGGVGLELAQDVRDCASRGKIKQQVDVIGGPADGTDVKISVGGDAAGECPRSRRGRR